MSQILHKFDNGYGASVIDHGYGSEDGLFEIAVIGPDGRIDCTTPITNDVLGYLTADDVLEVLADIEALPLLGFVDDVLATVRRIADDIKWTLLKRYMQRVSL